VKRNKLSKVEFSLYITSALLYMSSGSSETEWSIPEAGLIWAECLNKHFGIQHAAEASIENDSTSDLSSSSSSSSSSIHRIVPSVANGGVVMVTIGGGHYVPKMNDAVSIQSIPYNCLRIFSMFLYLKKIANKCSLHTSHHDGIQKHFKRSTEDIIKSREFELILILLS
jgi:hypothetical protein